MHKRGWKEKIYRCWGVQSRRPRGVKREGPREGIRSTAHRVRNGLGSAPVHATGARNTRTLQNPRPALGTDKRHALMEEALSLLALLELIALVGDRRQES